MVDYDRLAKHMFGFVRKRFQLKSEDIEDIIQEALTRSLEKYPHLHDREKERELGFVLYTICLRLTINHIRKANRYKLPSMARESLEWLQNKLLEHDLKAENYANRYFDREDINKVIGYMDQKYPKYAFILTKYIELEYNRGYNHEEIRKQLSDEFFELFQLRPTVAYYRKLKERALRKFIEYWGDYQ